MRGMDCSSGTIDLCHLAMALLFLTTSSAWATTPLGTGFTYQGHLQQDGARVNDACDCQFSLWDDASAGAQVGPTRTFDGAGSNPPPVVVADGLFSVELDFGAAAFNDEARWLQIAVACPSGGVLQPLSPRQPVTAAPYSLQTRGILVDAAGNAGIGTGAPLSALHVSGAENNGTSAALRIASGSQQMLLDGNEIDTNTSVGLYLNNNVPHHVLLANGGGSVGIGMTNPDARLDVLNPSTSGAARAVVGKSASTSGYGVVGHTTATSGSGVGVAGQSDGAGGIGVLGYTLATSGENYAIWGWNNSSSGRGVYGLCSATTGTNYGVYGESRGTSGRGVYGLAAATSGFNSGVYGESHSGNGTGVQGVCNASLGTGVRGEAGGFAGVGVHGLASSATGAGRAIWGQANDPDGYAGYFDGQCYVSGRLGVGTSLPNQKLHVVGNICATGSIGSCSDGRFKTDVRPLNGALAKVLKLRPVSYDWNRKAFPDHQFTKERQMGLIAQEVRGVLPEVVQKGSDGYLSVDYGRLTPILVEAVKEQHKAIERQQREIEKKDRQLAEQRGKMTELEGRLARLEMLISEADSRKGE